MYALAAHQIVPCNVRAQLNDITGKSLQFLACGRTYNIEVQKGPTRTRFGGEGWRRFISRNNLTGGEMLCFSIEGDTPRITIIYLNNGGESEDEEEEQEDDFYESPVISSRCKLTSGENEHLMQIIPPGNTFIGVPYVTRLTRTNVDRSLMVRILFQVTLSIHKYVTHPFSDND
jgi:hypothetical protein